MHHNKTIVESDDYRIQLAALTQNDVALADMLTSGSTFNLSRDPATGTQVSEHVWFAPLDGAKFLPSLVVYYTFTQDEVHLLHIASQH